MMSDDEQQAAGDEVAGADNKGAEGGAAMPAIDFSTFVLSLSTSVLYQLGEVPDPVTGKRLTPSPPLAQQTIETLEMLREKTRGNLDAEEARLLEGLLYELHMKFVEVGR